MTERDLIATLLRRFPEISFSHTTKAGNDVYRATWDGRHRNAFVVYDDYVHVQERFAVLAGATRRTGSGGPWHEYPTR